MINCHWIFRPVIAVARPIRRTVRRLHHAVAAKPAVAVAFVCVVVGAGLGSAAMFPGRQFYDTIPVIEVSPVESPLIEAGGYITGNGLPAELTVASQPVAATGERPIAVPEPSTLSLFALGIIGVIAVRSRVPVTTLCARIGPLWLRRVVILFAFYPLILWAALRGSLRATAAEIVTAFEI